MKSTIAIGHDHAGHPFRGVATHVVESLGQTPLLVSADTSEPSDYPEVASQIAEAITAGRAQRGILICGSGAGVTVAANTDPHVRAALAHEEYTARQMVEHDDVNVLTLGARVIGPELAASIIRAFLEATFACEERHAKRLAMVLEQRRRHYHNALHELRRAGQSVWLDSISCGLIERRTLARYIAELSVSGVTSNPSILEAAIGQGTSYDGRITALTSSGATDPEQIAFDLALEDITRAADLLLVVHHATLGLDGFVSIEVSPSLVDDAEATVVAGKALFAKAGRPNVMIKVPGTAAGLEAIEELVAAGIPVNVTLLFSPEHYTAAAHAYLNAIERRVRAGLSPKVASVASMFVSRWDAAVDTSLPRAQQGKLGLALMQQTLAAYQEIVAGARFAPLREAGALPQRVLWASTGTKNPNLPDTYYLGRLAAPGTVDTVPEKTLLAYADHGVTCDLMEPNPDAAAGALAEARAAGVDLDALAARLQRDGALAFSNAWNDLLASIERKLAG